MTPQDTYSLIEQHAADELLAGASSADIATVVVADAASFDLPEVLGVDS